jgi:hypothetical protein
MATFDVWTLGADGKEGGEGGERRYRQLAVWWCIGLASAAVVLAIPDPRGQVTQEAERFAARALAVRDDAILQWPRNEHPDRHDR